MTAEPLRDDATGPGVDPTERSSPVESALANVLTPRRERTRARLLDAAYTVFARDGIHGASIEAICETAGFTRGAFYSNFGSKEELFLALAERLKRQQLDALEVATRSLDPSAFRSGKVDHDAIAQVLDAVATDPDHNRQWTLLRSEFELLAMRDARVATLHAAHVKTLRKELADAITRILDTLGLRFVVDTGTAIEVLLAVHDAGDRRYAVENPLAEPNALDTPRGDQDQTTLSDLVDLLITTKP
ncbi:TetR/AcrR family transcriptional regulator [Myceligenerans pegani]|uniref:TetR/AcrR family transcriptional regulator n=1 Tax=Myceligenerans pegani TaxID=2776917 RepID=A0ABR9MRX9_9MICO|nr:TetR/AcrR family transcriptional regulator [Myceligenerans sp. TRM 65318]MBE1874142.1 TetR/AcrR family transcriptional regulator [Myceligenerans sp. TRM 65318]MBE3016414.1 TetR/AcrR family transcriptional regulator [Myceligenerans sp. TRM 65318]